MAPGPNAAPPVRVKVCGVARPADAVLAVEHGAWAIGCILWPGSGRYVDADAAREVVAAVAGRAETVAVMVDPTPEEAAAAVRRAGFSMVQVHGGDPLAVRAAAGVPVITAINHTPGARAETPPDVADALLVDGPRSGTGRAWPWAEARDVPRPDAAPLLVAGGLRPELVATARAALDGAAFALDVASGVESAPGVKDAELVAAFLAAARA